MADSEALAQTPHHKFSLHSEYNFVRIAMYVPRACSSIRRVRLCLLVRQRVVPSDCNQSFVLFHVCLLLPLRVYQY